MAVSRANNSQDSSTASITRQTRRSQRLAAARITMSVWPERKKPSGRTKPDSTKNSVTAAGPSIDAKLTLPSIAEDWSKPSTMPSFAGSKAHRKCQATTMNAARPRSASSCTSLLSVRTVTGGKLARTAVSEPAMYNGLPPPHRWGRERTRR
jgi:hypothetical protein